MTDWITREVNRAAAAIIYRSDAMDADDFQQDIWVALVEGRLDVSELRDVICLKRLRRECKASRLVSRCPRHVSADAPIAGLKPGAAFSHIEAFSNEQGLWS